MAPMLDALKTRAESIPFRNHKLIVRVVPSLGGAVGRFFEPRVGRNREPRIDLKTGRHDIDTWLTLCHELGHFASWASHRRPAGFANIEDRFATRRKTLSNYIITAAGGRDRKDPDVYQPLLDAAKAAHPQDQSEDERRMILDEERRAWCFAASIVDAVGFDKATFIAEANKALGWYFRDLELDVVSWSPTDCSTTDDIELAYIKELVR